MRKQILKWIIGAVVLLTLSACSAIPGMGEKQTEFEVGEKAATYWFDFTVNDVKTMDSYGEYEAGEGNCLVICDVTMKNTFSENVPMNWADFTLLWKRGEEDPAASAGMDGIAGMDGTYPLPQYTDEQLPDEYEIAKGATQEGMLIFEVPDDVTKVAVVFQELYAEGESESEYSEGDYYMVWVTL